MSWASAADPVAGDQHARGVVLGDRVADVVLDDPSQVRLVRVEVGAGPRGVGRRGPTPAAGRRPPAAHDLRIGRHSQERAVGQDLHAPSAVPGKGLLAGRLTHLDTLQGHAALRAHPHGVRRLVPTRTYRRLRGRPRSARGLHHGADSGEAADLAARPTGEPRPGRRAYLNAPLDGLRAVHASWSGRDLPPISPSPAPA